MSNCHNSLPGQAQQPPVGKAKRRGRPPKPKKEGEIKKPRAKKLKTVRNVIQQNQQVMNIGLDGNQILNLHKNSLYQTASGLPPEGIFQQHASFANCNQDAQLSSGNMVQDNLDPANQSDQVNNFNDDNPCMSGVDLQAQVLAQSSSHGSDCMIQVSNDQQEEQNEEDKLKNQDDLIPTSSSHETDLQQQQQQMFNQNQMLARTWYPQDPMFGSTNNLQQDNSLLGGQLSNEQQQFQLSQQHLLEQQQLQSNYQQQFANQYAASLGSSQPYMTQYALGFNGQYYKAVQGTDGNIRYEMVQQPNTSDLTNQFVPNQTRPSTSSMYQESEVEEPETPKSKKEAKAEDKNRIKRPMNAFLVWSCQQRAILAKNNPGMKNAEISIHLGERWKNMTPAQKQPFYDEAAKIKMEHKIKHPEWSYQPKPKKRRLGQGTTWLYAITENTRGGRVSHYINSYNHYDGNLVLSSLGSQPNQMSTLYNNQLLQQMQGQNSLGQQISNPNMYLHNPSLQQNSLGFNLDPQSLEQQNLDQQNLDQQVLENQDQSNEPDIVFSPQENQDDNTEEIHQHLSNELVSDNGESSGVMIGVANTESEQCNDLNENYQVETTTDVNELMDTPTLIDSHIPRS